MLLQMMTYALTIGYPMKDKIEGIKTIKFYVFTTQSYDKIIITFFVIVRFVVTPRLVKSTLI